MKKNAKVRSKFLKESLLDYDRLAKDLKENTTNAVRDILNEAVRDTYHQILKEEDEDDKEYDEEEVEDTTTDNESQDNADNFDNKETEEGTEFDDEAEEEPEEDDDADEESVEVSPEGDEVSIEKSGDDGEGDAWAEFDKYKIGDDAYDFSEAEDDEIVKVYKLLKDDDQVMVNQEDSKLNIKDNETGAEYLIDLGGSSDDAMNDEFEDEEFNENDMNESRIYEIALNEYDSHVGYTDNYQKQDVMSNPGMSEPGKNVNDWDAGVPKGDSKPWSGYPSKKSKADKPFTAGKGKRVEESIEEEDGEMPMGGQPMPAEGAAPMEEATNVGGKVQQRSTGAKTHGPNNPAFKNRPYNQHRTSIAGEYEGENEELKESIVRKANKIFKENKQLYNVLGKHRDMLQEAAVTNVNLGNIIKLISENTTSKDEKMEIIARFGKEARTVKESKRLYEDISRELKKNGKMNITESKQFSLGAPQKINETQIYKSPDLMESLDLMHRLCK